MYSRENCHLCAAAIATVEAVVEEVTEPVEASVVDVDDHPELREALGDHVPVVAVDGEPRFALRVDADELRAAITGAE